MNFARGVLRGNGIRAARNKSSTMIISRCVPLQFMHIGGSRIWGCGAADNDRLIRGSRLIKCVEQLDRSVHANPTSPVLYTSGDRLIQTGHLTYSGTPAVHRRRQIIQHLEREDSNFWNAARKQCLDQLLLDAQGTAEPGQLHIDLGLEQQGEESHFTWTCW